MAYRPPWKKDSQPAPRQEAAQPNSAPQQRAAQPNSAPQQVAKPNHAPQQAAQSTSQKVQVYISTKIINFHSATKAIDFNSLLVPAKKEDFAMIHGCGGKNHAKNSTIGVVICDHSKGTGDKSLTLRYNIDVHAIDELYQAALEKPRKAWELLHPNNPTRPGPGDIPYAYTPEAKVNHYVRNAKGYSPVSRLEIKYCPIRKDGTISRNPWYIAISNCDAPVQTRQNGAVTYNGKAAENRKAVFVNMSYEEFSKAMTAIWHNVLDWELSCNKKQFIEGYQAFNDQWANKE